MNEPSSVSPLQNRLGGRRELSPAEFKRIATLLQSEAGIELTPAKLPLAHSRLSARLRALGLKSYGDYCDFIESQDGKDERLEMLSVLTTNVTRFYREPHHFENLTKVMIPELMTTLKKGGSARIWSAGCSTGEEPYTLALTFLSAAPDIARYDFKILASDIDPTVLKTAETGIYAAHSLAQVPEAQRRRYFSQADAKRDTWAVGAELKKLIEFQRLNLIGNWSFPHQFDVIMCRNVVIYFAPETKALVWNRFLQQLRPGGWLITGHSERLSSEAATLTETIHTTTYRRR